MLCLTLALLASCQRREVAPELKRAPEGGSAIAVHEAKLSDPDRSGHTLTVPEQVEAIDKRHDNCSNDAGFSDFARFKCEEPSRKDLYALAPRSQLGRDLERLFAMLQGAMVFGMHGENSAESVNLTNGEFYDLAKARAEILNDLRLDQPEAWVGALDPGPRLAWLRSPFMNRYYENDPSERDVPIRAEKLWNSIRDRDCQAYPVRHCAERLNNAFSRIVDSGVIEEHDLFLNEDIRAANERRHSE